MIENEKTLVLFRKDLNRIGRKKSIEDVQIEDIANSIKPVQRAAFVVFIDDVDGTTKMLKNRSGNNGLIK